MTNEHDQPAPANPAPGLDHVCDLHVRAGGRSALGDTGLGERRTVAIVGGRVEGPAIDGEIVGDGADWQTVRPDGTVEIDARYLIETHDGARIEIADRGIRHGPPDVMARLATGEVVPADEYTMIGAIRMTTGDDRYRWVNTALFVGVGARTADGVTISVYRAG
ncbi:MAG: DUF3237 domain-containing protein [Ilumatobacter sp.]|nr:DUF3237 domain-containing protein [Ilumatobacter sp.]